MKRTNLTRVPLLLGAVLTTLTAIKFDHTWRNCVVGNAAKVWPGLTMRVSAPDYAIDSYPQYDTVSGFPAVAEYLDISVREAFGFACSDGKFTRLNQTKKLLQLIVNYLRGKGDTQIA